MEQFVDGLLNNSIIDALSFEATGHPSAHRTCVEMEGKTPHVSLAQAQRHRWVVWGGKEGKPRMLGEGLIPLAMQNHCLLQEAVTGNRKLVDVVMGSDL